MTRSQAIWAISLLAILSIFFAFQLPGIRFNYVFEDFFPVDDPELAYYQEFREEFGEDNNYLLIGLIPDKGVFESTFLQQLDSLTRRLEKHPYVVSVVSLTNSQRPLITPTGIVRLPLVHPYDPGRLKQDSIFISEVPLLQGSLLSEDNNATAILLRHTSLTGEEESTSLLDFINQSLDLLPATSWHVAGKIHAQRVFITTMQKELITFLSASLVLIVLFLAVAYRSLWLIMLPLVVVLLGAVWILGIMSLAGKALDILMVLLPTIMFVVGMSDVVHIMTKYIEQLRLGKPKKTAIIITFKEVGLATFLTSLTTAVGFFTLLTASIRPIREFGIYTGIGVFVAFIVAFTLIPASLTLMRPPAITRKMYHRSSWFGFLSRSFTFVLRHARPVIVVTLVVTAISVAGIRLIHINTFLIEDLPADHPLKEDFTFFDREFGGSRPFEMTAEVKGETSIFDPDVIREMDKLTVYLEQTYEADNLISPVTLVKTMNQAMNGGVRKAFELPSSQAEWKRLDRYLSRIEKTNRFDEFISEDGNVARISGRVEDIGSAISLARTDSLRKFIDSNINEELVDFTLTGTSNLIDKNNEYLARNMFYGLGIAFGVVALIAGILFRSLRMVLITLIPNVIPLLIVAAIMGFTGITLKLSTSIVFTIAFGIAVDDTIHFISKLKIELQKGRSLLYALKRTYLSTGKAIIVTSIILSGGFLTLLLSSFGGTFYTGLLISMTLVLALIIDLTLLPVLIYCFYKNKNHKER